MKKTIYIEGMSCKHCVGHVERALKEVEGVKEVLVDLKEKNAVVEITHSVDDEKLKEAIEEAGYDVVEIK